ncbi:winged helix-turn-helix transcriptional regulator [Candidatus Woesearchaeota archaeon]|nr:winged helix-turn-helix transcriptional regulator [Candidatus Woesearchaeota archaeon]
MNTETYIQFFKALSSDTRLSIILCLEKNSKNVTEIVNELKMEQSRISHNLQCLEKNGFVTVKQNGKQRIYSLNKDTIAPILKDTKKHTQKYNINRC